MTPSWARLVLFGSICFLLGFWLSRAPVNPAHGMSLQSQNQMAKPVEPRFESRRRAEVNVGSRTPQQPDRIVSRSGFAEKLGVTPDDWAQTQELNRRERQGDYVLRFERPTTRKFLNHDFKELVSQMSQQNSAEYDRVFSGLGVTPIKAEQLKSHLGQIHRASLEAGVAAQQLVAARNDYDARIRQTLGEEGYVRYREYEDSKPAWREVGKLQQQLVEGGRRLDPAAEASIAGLIQEHQTYTEFTSHGPYDTPRPPAIGQVQVIDRLSQQQAQLVERANALIEHASRTGLSDELIEGLHAYYSSAIEQFRSQIERVRNPPPDPHDDLR